MENNEFDMSADLPDGETIDEVCSLPDEHSGIKLKDMVRTTFFLGVITMLIALAVVL
jgi:hypothetical protein